MRYLLLALAGAFLLVPRAHAEPTGGYVACPLNAGLLGSDANGSCIRVTPGTGLTLSTGGILSATVASSTVTAAAQSCSGATTIPFTAGAYQTTVELTMTAACQITIASGAAGQEQLLNLELLQGTGGGFAPTFTNVSWAGGVTPTFNSIAGKRDLLGFRALTADIQGWPVSMGRTPVGAQTAPNAPSSVTVVAGNAQNTITVGAVTANPAVTGYTYRRGLTSGGEISTPIATNVASPYVDTGLTNGTAYFYTAAAVNAIGTGPYSTAEGAGTPALPAAPAHYLAVVASSPSNASAPPTAGNGGGSDGFIDEKVWVNFSTYTPSGEFFLVGKWSPTGGTGDEYVTTIKPSGVMNTVFFDTLGAAQVAVSTVAIATANPSATLGIWLRTVINNGPNPTNGFAGATVTYQTSPDGVAWTNLGTPIGSMGAHGINSNQGTLPLAIGTTAGGGAPPPFTVYKLVMTASDGRILANPDFTAQASGTTSFVDTAGVPNTWTFSGATEH